MKTYSEEFKTNIVARMLPPNNCKIAELAKETGVHAVTLRAWLSKYGGMVGKCDTTGKSANDFTSETKFQYVIECSSMNEHEIGEYCRRRGIFPEQLMAWRNACLVANECHHNRKDKAEKRELSKQIKQLEGELHRKEKALAEAAVLLMLQKKVRTILEANGDVNLNYLSGAW